MPQLARTGKQLAYKNKRAGARRGCATRLQVCAPRLHLFSAELELLVLRAEALSRLPGEFPFAEVLLGEDDRKSVDVSSLAAGQRGERSGIDAAAQENPQRHVRDQVTANDIFEQQPQLFSDRAAGAFDRSRRWPRGLANIPIGFAANI